jgi:GNAT superfamily N-acetyltransferase
MTIEPDRGGGSREADLAEDGALPRRPPDMMGGSGIANGDVRIRLARPGDGSGLTELHLDTAITLRGWDSARFKVPDVDGMAEWIDADLETAGEECICFVAEVDGRIVGQVEARVHPPLESARYQTVANLGLIRGEVNSLGVVSTHRRRGIGRALMAEAERWLKDRGAGVIVLDTFLRSPESGPFYDALGYERVSVVFERPI